MIANNQAYKILVLKNNARLRPCISKINNTIIENSENPSIVMAKYNLLEHRDSYLWHQEIRGVIIEKKWMVILMKMTLLTIE